MLNGNWPARYQLSMTLGMSVRDRLELGQLALVSDSISTHRRWRFSNGNHSTSIVWEAEVHDPPPISSLPFPTQGDSQISPGHGRRYLGWAAPPGPGRLHDIAVLVSHVRLSSQEMLCPSYTTGTVLWEETGCNVGAP